jgi:hypothetical protein
MPDEPGIPPQVEVIPSRQGTVSAIASSHAPFIFFDNAPTYGFRDGVANITLEALRFSGVGDQVLVDRVVVAHLRMSYPALQYLKAAINGIELIAAPAPPGQTN